MLEPNAIIGIVSSSIGLAVAVIGLAARSAEVGPSEDLLQDVEEQTEKLERQLYEARYRIASLRRKRQTREVCGVMRETKKLIEHSDDHIERFGRFHQRFLESRTVRTWNYIAIAAGSDETMKYAHRFQMYSDWISIALLSMSLTPVIQRASPGGTGLPPSCWEDVKSLRQELKEIKRDKLDHPGRVRKLYVYKGVDLRCLERYADKLDSKFGDLATQAYSLIDHSSGTIFAHHDQVYGILRVPPKAYTSASRSRSDAGRGEDDRGSEYNQSRGRAASGYAESSSSRRSSKLTPSSGHDGNDGRETAPIPQGGHRPYERHRRGMSREQAYTVTSGPGRSESTESSRHSRHRRQSDSHTSETDTRPCLHPSCHSERDSDGEIRGRDKRERSFQDTRQNASSTLPRRPPSNSSHSSSHTDMRWGQQRTENIANIELRPSTRRHGSRSSSANASSVPSHDSGYGSLRHERYSSDASTASTRRRSSSRQHPRKRSGSDGGDRSRLPIALDKTEEGANRRRNASRASRGAR